MFSKAWLTIIQRPGNESNLQGLSKFIKKIYWGVWRWHFWNIIARVSMNLYLIKTVNIVLLWALFHCSWCYRVSRHCIGCSIFNQMAWLYRKKITLFLCQFDVCSNCNCSRFNCTEFILYLCIVLRMCSNQMLWFWKWRGSKRYRTPSSLWHSPS